MEENNSSGEYMHQVSVAQYFYGLLIDCFGCFWATLNAAFFYLYPRRIIPMVHLRFCTEYYFDTVIALEMLSFDVKSCMELFFWLRNTYTLEKPNNRLKKKKNDHQLCFIKLDLWERCRTCVHLYPLSWSVLFLLEILTVCLFLSWIVQEPISFFPLFVLGLSPFFCHWMLADRTTWLAVRLLYPPFPHPQLVVKIYCIQFQFKT